MERWDEMSLKLGGSGPCEHSAAKERGRGAQELRVSEPPGLICSDPRHNFSFVWYRTYLTHGQAASWSHAVLGFLPQASILLVLAWVYARDLPFCMFVQTFAFVAFNKVSTAQYFVWFFALLPVALPSLSGTTLVLAMAFAAWGLGQVHWLVRSIPPSQKIRGGLCFQCTLVPC
jgi:hypothetical protein